MIKYLIWDLDGTLFDTYPAFTESFLMILRDHGYSTDADWVLSLTKVGFSHCASLLASQYGLIQEEVEKSFWQNYEDVPHEDQYLMQGAKELCEYMISEGGMNVIVTHRDRASMIGLLETHKVEALFTDCIAGDEGFPLKPDPSAVEAIIERNDIVKELAVLVGDRDMDAGAGLAAGVRTCLLNARYSSVQADYHVDHLNELRQLIQEENDVGLKDTSNLNT